MIQLLESMMIKMISKLLEFLSGVCLFILGHLESQITCIELSTLTWLFASGSENGIVTLWDF